MGIISLSKMKNEYDDILNNYLILFEDLLSTNYQQANMIYQQIKSEYPHINQIDQEFHFLLLEQLLFIRTNNELKAIESAKKVEYLYDEKTFDLQNEKIQKLYYYVNALYHYFQKDFVKSHDYYLKQLPLIQDCVEKAKTYFNISLIFLKLKDPQNAVTYANSALELYLHSQELEKAIDIYIFLCVLFWENNQLPQAEKAIKKAKKLAIIYKLENNLDKIYHNLGLIYESKQDFKTALEYFEKSLELKIKNEKSNLILTYRSLVENHLKINDIHSAKEILKKAFLICYTQLDYCLLNVLSAKVNLTERDYQSYEKIMEESIQFLFEIKEYKEVFNLAEELGGYYQERNNYLKAAYYYRLGLQAKKN